MSRVIVILALYATGACCAGGEASVNATTPSPREPHGNQPAAAAQAPQGGVAAPTEEPPAELSGKVLETVDAAGYTYLRLATDDGEQWAAVPQAVVTVGATVKVLGAMRMDGFESKTLQRRFDRLLFATLASPAAPTAAAPNDDVHAAGAARPASEGVSADAPVERAPGGRTVSEVFSQRSALSGKEISVRGRVTKLTPNVLGRTWLHLVDGTGSAASGDHDLVVTTTQLAEVGQVIVVTGKVVVDRDFGAGYSYKVLVEDAKLTR